MMPVKEILDLRPIEPKPPIMVIDEATVRATVDAGPVCGCHEKYAMVQNYKPFIPGGVNPYRRRKIPDSESFDVAWGRIRIGTYDLLFEKPFARHKSELSENHQPPKDQESEDEMYLRLPEYTEEYFLEKLRECKREHVEGCSCFDK